ncbi:uncharacterized protein LOC134023664 [Osmerus eperlanus]|uniref:uncharacterized protein LOC134023664 n=1 Tax=Osmerus eperlanus TaxID=29151 RepID=UPI002E15CD2A
MNLILSLCFVLLIGSADVWLTSSSVHFGDQGDNMTLISRFETDISTHVTWFRQDLSGKVTLVKFFSNAAMQTHDRYFVAVDGSNIMSTVIKTTTEDSGRYFAVRRNGVNFEAGTIQDIVVTDQLAVPVMRVFLQSGPGRVFLCEVTGAGQGWSEPYWMGVDGHNMTVDSETIRSFDENGLFTQSTILIPSLADGVKAAMCVCRRESTGTMIQSVIQILTTENVMGSCDILLYVVLLACLLLLLAGAAAAVRATRSGCVTI